MINSPVGGATILRALVPMNGLVAKIAVGLSLMCLLLSPAFSAIVYWDGDGVDVVGGGAGTWDTTLARWSPAPDGSTYQPWNNANNDDAVFSGTGAQVFLGPALTANSLTFTVSGYNLNVPATTPPTPVPVLSSPSGTLTVGAPPTGQAVINFQYDAAISTIVKNGAGLLSSGTSQTAFVGKWIINGGIVSFPGDLRIGKLPSAVVPDQITLDGAFLRSSTSNVVFDAKRGIVLGPNGGGFDVSPSFTTSITWNGPISGTQGGSFTKNQGFNLILTNNNSSYDGNTLVTAGRLTVGAANALGNAVGNTQVSNGAGLVFDGVSSNFTINEPIQIEGTGLGADGGAIAVLNGANITFGGPITLSSDAAVSVASTATATYTNTDAFTSSADQTLTLQGDALTTGGGGLITGAISLGNGGLIKAQGGKWTLVGLSTYFGTTIVSEGTLIVSGSISGTSQVEVSGTLGGGGSMTLGNGGSVAVLPGGKLSPGTSTGALTITLSGGGGLDITNGVIAANSQSLIFELGAPGASDKISLIGGPLSIGSGGLEFDDFVLTAVSGFVPLADYVLFDGTMPILGTLGANLTGTVNGFTATIQLADGGNDLVLHVIPEPSVALAILGGTAMLLGLRRRQV
jgi:autotransporter-associated beta strand protein